MSQQKIIQPDHTQTLNFKLKSQNLVPIYLLEDSLKYNFQTIQSFISNQENKNKHYELNNYKLSNSIIEVDKNYTQKFPQMEKIIFNNIKKQIQATVSVILNTQLSTIIQKIQQSQQKEAEKEVEMKKTLSQIQKKLSYEISQQNQKYFAKQIARIQKQMDKKIQNFNQKNKQVKNENSPTKKIKKDIPKQQIAQKQRNVNKITSIIHSQNHPGEIQTIKQSFQELKRKVQNLQQFSTNIDKRFVTNFSSIKQNWKELGTQLLDNKKTLTKKVDQLNIEFVKIKNLTDFNNMPETMEESFKKKVMQKFTDFFKITSNFISKTQFQMVNDRNKKIQTRQTEELMSIRQQLAKNNQYFTLYMNNTQTDDLNQNMMRIKADILSDKKYFDTLFREVIQKSDKNKKSIQQITKSLGEVQGSSENSQQKINKINGYLIQMKQKISQLQDLNDIGPSKMKKIHDTLDLQHNFGQKEISLDQIHKINSNNTMMNKQMKRQIQKIKDQMFLIISQKNMNGIVQQDDLIQVKNEIKRLNMKIERLKNDSEEALISRKPWVCMSCDKQKIKQKTKEQILQKNPSKKKISVDLGRSGGFMTNRSQKIIKINPNSPVGEQKFEIYEKYRQKYLSDTLKLPQIYKQKFGIQEANLL